MTAINDYFLPEEFDEENWDFHEYMQKIYENRDNLYFIP
jgi:hypothetical protein